MKKPSPHVSAVLLLVLGSAVGISGAEEIPFSGEQIWREDTGFSVWPEKDKGLLAVMSAYHHYSMVLPYSDSWIFETSKEKPLNAKGGGFVVSIQIVPKLESSEKKKLKNILLSVRESDQTDVRRHHYLDFYGRLALRYQVRAKEPPAELEELNEWRYTYWTVIKREDMWYVLHLTPPPLEPPFQDDVPPLVELLLGAGFRVDYEQE